MLHRARPRAVVLRRGRRCRAAIEALHNDRDLEDLGACLVDAIACRFLDEPVVLEGLQKVQDARTGTARDRYRAAVRTLEAQWRVTAAGTPTPTG